jgi:hypothetical protein
MEMERKDKSRSVVVDKLLMGTNSPFTRWVADYRLPEKFKIPQILSYTSNPKLCWRALNALYCLSSIHLCYMSINGPSPSA